jgi:acyl-CoA synthetase (AMP-forming)/AMP-acid ligase II
MIIRAGENIYPREIDDLLYTHPAIAHAAVIGVPDDLYGEEVAAFVVLKDGSKLSADELIEFCRKHLADYKCPKSVAFRRRHSQGPDWETLETRIGRVASE